MRVCRKTGARRKKDHGKDEKYDKFTIYTERLSAVIGENGIETISFNGKTVSLYTIVLFIIVVLGYDDGTNILFPLTNLK